MTGRRTRFLIVRRSPRSKTGFVATWDQTTEDEREARAVAQCLVEDPQDAIERICLWSERDQQFSGVVRREAS